MNYSVGVRVQREDKPGPGKKTQSMKGLGGAGGAPAKESIRGMCRSSTVLGKEFCPGGEIGGIQFGKKDLVSLSAGG